MKTPRREDQRSSALLSKLGAFLVNLSAMSASPATNSPSGPVSPFCGEGPAALQRIFVSVAIGVASGLLCRALMRHLNLGAADFNYALREGRDLLAGRDPYAIFHGATSYPLPAAILALPFLRFSPETASGMFFGLSSACLAFALSRHGKWRLLAFLAYPYWAAMLTVQWAPLLMAGALLPWLFAAAVAKPQLGAPLFFGYPNWRGASAAALLLLASLLAMPKWPLRWLIGVGAHTHFVPMLVLPGPALLLALYRRRDPDSHLLLLGSLTPQHWFYDSFILWLIPKTRQEILATVVLSWGAGITRWYFMPYSWNEVGTWAVLWIYLPMLGIILLRQWRPQPISPLQDTPRSPNMATSNK